MNDEVEVYNKNEMMGMDSQLSVQAAREIQEVQGQIIMAKKFPRNEQRAIQRILTACKREGLAKSAMYLYPRGRTTVTGPSIRLAEVIAQNWGNLVFGVKEIEQRDGESVVESFAWCLETNVRQSKIFTVKHERKAGGKVDKLTDPRDIYEHIANNGARRLRNCILGIVPIDIVEESIEQCKLTLSGKSDKPFEDRVRAMSAAYEKFGVSVDMIENKIGRPLKEMVIDDLNEMLMIYNSLRDGMTKIKDWFGSGREKSEQTDELNERLKREAKELSDRKSKEAGAVSTGKEDQGRAGQVSQDSVKNAASQKTEKEKEQIIKTDNVKSAPSFKI